MNFVERVETDTENDKVVIEPSYLPYLRSNGYAVEGVANIQIIPSNSRDAAHVVCKIDTYEYPRGHERLDVSAHSLTIPVCSCEDYQYNKTVDVSETPLGEGTIGRCKHIKDAYHEAKARADEAQDELF